MRRRSTGIRLIKQHVENPNHLEFDEFEDSEEGPDLGLGDKPGSLLDYLRAQHKRVARSRFQSMPGLPLRRELTLHDFLI